MPVYQPSLGATEPIFIRGAVVAGQPIFDICCPEKIRTLRINFKWDTAPSAFTLSYLNSSDGLTWVTADIANVIDDSNFLLPGGVVLYFPSGYPFLRIIAATLTGGAGLVITAYSSTV